jgi:hypothetical protein
MALLRLFQLSRCASYCSEGECPVCSNEPLACLPFVAVKVTSGTIVSVFACTSLKSLLQLGISCMCLADCDEWYTGSMPLTLVSHKAVMLTLRSFLV